MYMEITVSIKIYCDICEREMIEPIEEQYDLIIKAHDKWESHYQYHIEDVCRTCYLDIIEEIERKKKFYRDKHEMEDACIMTI